MNLIYIQLTVFSLYQISFGAAKIQSAIAFHRLEMNTGQCIDQDRIMSSGFGVKWLHIRAEYLSTFAMHYCLQNIPPQRINKPHP